ncbi:MAG: superoxide dismutase [Bacteroidales bacterium]|nr:superoxide dismutase [Bacteroidales bacterium]
MDNSIFTPVALPYAQDALAPVISPETIAFHYGKHLQAYINNLNAALPGSGFEGKELEEIVRTAEGGIFNNAGQVLNHTLYFTQLKPAGAESAPEGALAGAIARDFGSFEAFKAEFQKKGAGLFGSGWVWLASDAEGRLQIVQEVNAGNPVRRGLKPLLTFDVWEHAYYLDYQNRRPDHLAALWQIVDWSVISARYGF